MQYLCTACYTAPDTAKELQLRGCACVVYGVRHRIRGKQGCSAAERLPKLRPGYRKGCPKRL